MLLRLTPSPAELLELDTFEAVLAVLSARWVGDIILAGCFLRSSSLHCSAFRSYCVRPQCSLIVVPKQLEVKTVLFSCVVQLLQSCVAYKESPSRCVMS